MTAFLLLAPSSLFSAGNRVIGRALRDSIDPVTLNFWRWLIAALVLAPFALPAIAANRQAAAGANAAGFTLHLLPAFGTLLGIVVLGETFQGFHAAGIATIPIGVVVATHSVPQRFARAGRADDRNPS